MMRLSVLIGACALFATTAAAQASPYAYTDFYTVMLEEVGSNVVANGSGDIGIDGLGVSNVNSSPGVQPNLPYIEVGGSSMDYVVTANIAGPTSFGSGAYTPPSSSTGATVGIYDNQYIIFPTFYASDTFTSQSMIFSNANFATLGVTPGTYQWTWISGGGSEITTFTLEIGQTPIPAALPLFATGLGALGLLGSRRKRKAQAVVA
jgi:hypothetical protein